MKNVTINQAVVENKPQRKNFIDALRGMAMLIVVYGHCLLSKSTTDYAPFFVFTSPWNVALFFSISGYLFSPRGGDVKVFFKYIFRRLIVPWLVLGLFPYTHILQTLPQLLSGETLWFMPALIIAEIVWFFVFKLCHDDEKKVIFVGLILSAIGLLLYKYNVMNYAMFNRALTVLWLFVLGLMLRKYEIKLVAVVKRFLIPFALLYIVLGVIFLLLYPNCFYDIHVNRYYFIPLTWGIIALGIIIAFSVFSNINKFPNWLILIGKNTLVIYILHGYGRYLFSKILTLLPLPYTLLPYPVLAVFEMAFACAICLGLSLLVNRFVPEIVGLKRHRSNETEKRVK